MKKIVYYKCDYCGSKTRNLLKFRTHEENCKNISLTQDIAVRRLTALVHSYEKLGYRISIVYHTDGQQFITVYHPDYGKFK